MIKILTLLTIIVSIPFASEAQVTKAKKEKAKAKSNSSASSSAKVKTNSSSSSAKIKTNSISSALPSAKSTTATERMETIRDDFSVWEHSLTAEYTPESRQNPDSNMFYVGDFNYRPVYAHRFRLYQRVEQQIIPESGKDNSNEVQVLNPRLQYFYNFQDPPDQSYHLALRLGTEWGTSKIAKEDGFKFLTSMRLEFDKQIGFMTVSLRPYFAYWVTEYSTNALGDPMPMFSAGHNLQVFVPITEKFSWAFEFDTAFLMFQPNDVKDAQSFNEDSESDGEPLETSKSVLYFGTDFAYILTETVQARFGWYQFDNFMSDGKYELALFKGQTTRFFIGIDYLF